MKTEKKGRLVLINFDNEKKHNVLTIRMLKDFRKILRGLSEERAVIITGKVFSAGADVKQLLSYTEKEAAEYQATGRDVCSILESMDRLTIAAIEGFCIGGGLEIAASCDIRVASKNALFGLPELKLGMLPMFNAFSRVRAIVGEANLREMLFTSELFYAEKAKKIGLIHRIENDPLKQAMKTAETFSGISYNAFISAKRALMEGCDAPVPALPDMKEGMLAFLENRKPRFG